MSLSKCLTIEMTRPTPTVITPTTTSSSGPIPTATDPPDTTNEDGAKFVPFIVSPKGNLEILECTLPSLTVTLHNVPQSAIKTQHLFAWEITLREYKASRSAFALNYVSQSVQISTKQSPIKLPKGTYQLGVSAKNFTNGYYNTTVSEAYLAHDCNGSLNDANFYSLCFVSIQFNMPSYLVSTTKHTTTTFMAEDSFFPSSSSCYFPCSHLS
jgi:hypothetical protein